MSNIIQLGEHKWQLPPEPSSHDEVFFVKEKKENQYWRRQTDFPQYFYDWDYETKMFADLTLYDSEGNLLSLNEDNSKTLIRLRDRELHRRIHGIWFMNNGELTYMTGGHYFILQWLQMAGYTNDDTGESYGQYREFQAKLAYFMQMCKEDKDCAGAYILKPKKTGVTQYIAGDFLDESTRMRGRIFGMMSKSKDDAKDTNFMYYKYGLDNLPNIMKPAIQNQHLTMIYYGNPNTTKNASRKSRAKIYGNPDLKWLHTRVSALPTKDNAFDGPKIFRAWTDELPKYIDPYPENVYKKTVASVKLQDTIKGKWWISSYTPENDDRSYKEALKIYNRSRLKTKNEFTNRTKSELYNYFISALDAWEDSFDKYGKGDRQKAQISIYHKMEDLKSEKEMNELQAFIRQNPITEADAWRQGGGEGSIFDNLRISRQKQEIDEEEAVGKLRFTSGNLKWTGERKNSPVIFVATTEEDAMKSLHGPFRMYRMDKIKPASFNLSFANNIKGKNGKIGPPEVPIYLAGIDPTDYANKKHVVVGSKNAIYVCNFPDPELNAYHNAQVSNRIVCRYLHRHEKPSETYEDVLKIIYYFGCPVVVESNKPWLVTMLINDGLENFILIRDSKTKAILPYNKTLHGTLISTQRAGNTDVIDEYVRAGMEYLAEPATEDDFDNLDNLDDSDLLQQLMDFDTGDTKKYDAAVAFLYCILGMISYSAVIKRLKEKGDNYNKAIIARMTEVLVDDE